MSQVVDYSFSRPAPASIAQAGYVGVMRYLSGGGSKDLTGDELRALTGMKLAVGVVWETVANRAGQGQTAGHDDAVAANAQADRLGLPKDLPIYYAVDFQATWAQVKPYFVGAVAAGLRPVRPYGSYDIVESFWADFRAPGWQCAAWSGSGTGTGGSIDGRRVSVRACLFQKVGTVLNNSSDVNEVLAADWGQYPRPTPAPPQEEDVPSALVLDKSVPQPWPVYHVMGLERLHVATEEDCQWLVGLGASDMRGAPDDTQAKLVRNTQNIAVQQVAAAGDDVAQLSALIEALPAQVLAALKAKL